jgi:hypothetical protein
MKSRYFLLFWCLQILIHGKGVTRGKANFKTIIVTNEILQIALSQVERNICFETRNLLIKCALYTVLKDLHKYLYQVSVVY